MSGVQNAIKKLPTGMFVAESLGMLGKQTTRTALYGGIAALCIVANRAAGAATLTDNGNVRADFTLGIMDRQNSEP